MLLREPLERHAVPTRRCVDAIGVNTTLPVFVVIVPPCSTAREPSPRTNARRMPPLTVALMRGRAPDPAPYAVVLSHEANTTFGELPPAKPLAPQLASE